MENAFAKAMSGRTDHELIQIVTVDKEGYQTSAVEAAEEEIRKRGVDIEKVEQVKTILATEVENQKTLNAGKVGLASRFLHSIIDTIAFFLLATILSIIVDLFFNPDHDTSKSIGYDILIISFLSYYIFMEYKFQKTIGKFITKTSVINKNGQKPELGDILRRTFCRLIPFDAFSYFFTANGIHDSLSDTRVVKDRSLTEIV
jgi:uncharacterized RDD family membrane protein YckC